MEGQSEDLLKIQYFEDCERMGTITEEEAAELAVLKARQGGSSASPMKASEIVAKGGDESSTASKAAYFWCSLMATAVPGYIGRKVGVTPTFSHWNFITDRVILGALPVLTQVGESGNHLMQIKERLASQQLTLGMVVACLEAAEMDGFGVRVISFAKEKDWRDIVNPNITYLHVPFVDTSAAINFEAIAQVVVQMHDCISQGQAVYVHCKAGKGRSWMVVIGYLTTFGKMTFKEACDLVKAKRNQINPSTSQRIFASEFSLQFQQWQLNQNQLPA